MALLAAGRIAFHVDALEDALRLPSGDSVPLFTSCPWDLVAACPHNGAPPPGEGRLEGISLGVRAVLRLVAAVREVGGPAAVLRLALVIHASEDGTSQALEQLRALGMCG